MSAPIYNLDDTVYVTDIIEKSIKKGIITKVTEGTPNQYTVEYIYPDSGTAAIIESKIFSLKSSAILYLFDETGFRYTTDKVARVESGVWTPTLFGLVTNPYEEFPLELDSSYGEYQIFGDFITCTGWLYRTITNGGSASGNLKIGGFPFVCQIAEGSDPNVDYISYSANMCFFQGFTYPAGATVMTARLYNGELYDHLDLYWMKNTAPGYAPVTPTDISDEVYFEFTITYRITQ